MILRTYYLGCLSHASYLLGDEASGTAIVVDPQRDVDRYLLDAEQAGLTIRHVVLTHFHADFLAGHLELRQRTGATIHLGARAEADYHFEPLHEGTAWDLPSLRVDVLESPGHTPEMVNLILHDKARPGAPVAVLTGDTLFSGDVGRPDLVASRGHSAEALAGMLFDSLQKLKALPDATVVLPTHGAGSSCGKSIAGLETTIGEQKRSNPAFRLEDKQAFVRLVTTDLPPAPAYFAVDADLNRREHAPLEATEPPLLPIEAVVALGNRGAQIVDTRPAKEYAAKHLAGSVHVGIDGNYAPWAGAVLDPSRPIVLVTEPGRAAESSLRLGRIGFDNVTGRLATSLAEVAQTHPDAVQSATRLSPDEAATQTANGAYVLDVRNPSEHAALRLAHSHNIPLAELPARLDEVPNDRPVLVHCASGYRSSIAASLLRRAGLRDVRDVVGGLNALALTPQADSLLETTA